MNTRIEETLDEFPIVRRAREARQSEPTLFSWASRLPELLKIAQKSWDIHIIEPLKGGTLSVVYGGVRASTNEPIVLRIAPATQQTRAELEALLRVSGDAGPLVYAHDLDQGMVLMERLGQPLHASGLGVERELRLCVAALKRVWVPLPNQASFQSVAQWVEHSAAKHRGWWRDAGEPCSENLLSKAQTAAHRIVLNENETKPVLLMGDPHPGNLLATRDGRDWKWIDFAGLYGAPEFDLGKMLASWHDSINTASSPSRILSRHASVIAEEANVDLELLRAYGLYHRVTTGLWLFVIGHRDWGKAMLTATEPLVDAW